MIRCKTFNRITRKYPYWLFQYLIGVVSNPHLALPYIHSVALFIYILELCFSQENHSSDDVEPKTMHHFYIIIIYVHL